MKLSANVVLRGSFLLRPDHPFALTVLLGRLRIVMHTLARHRVLYAVPERHHKLGSLSVTCAYQERTPPSMAARAASHALRELTHLFLARLRLWLAFHAMLGQWRISGRQLVQNAVWDGSLHRTIVLTANTARFQTSLLELRVSRVHPDRS